MRTATCWRVERFNAGDMPLKIVSAILRPSRVGAGGELRPPPAIRRTARAPLKGDGGRALPVLLRTLSGLSAPRRDGQGSGEEQTPACVLRAGGWKRLHLRPGA